MIRVGGRLGRRRAEDGGTGGGADDVVLGTLRSDFDAPEQLPPEFVAAQEAFAAVLDEWRAGRLDRAGAYAAIRDRCVVERAGETWTIGASSGSWYRKGVDGRWVAARPPQIAGEAVVESTWQLRAYLGVVEDRPLVTLAAAPAAGVDEPTGDAWAGTLSFDLDAGAPDRDDRTGTPAAADEDGPGDGHRPVGTDRWELPTGPAPGRPGWEPANRDVPGPSAGDPGGGVGADGPGPPEGAADRLRPIVSADAGTGEGGTAPAGGPDDLELAAEFYWDDRAGPAAP